ERLAAVVTRFTGSMKFVYIHLAIVGFWVAVNAGLTPLEKFDPTFVLLATIASVEAIFLTTFVLMTQNRMQAEADRRADLDLQISLLTEHELTQLARLVTDLAARMHVERAEDPETQEIERDVEPVEVLDTLEKKKRQYERADTERDPGGEPGEPGLNCARAARREYRVPDADLASLYEPA